MGKNIESEDPNSTYKVDDALLDSFLVANRQFAFLGSSISQSEQELKISPLLAAYPRLPPADPSSFVQFSQNEMAKISIAILSAWGKALVEAAELVKKVLNSPEFIAHQEGKQDKVRVILVERYTWLNSLGALISALIHMHTHGLKGVTQVSGVDKGLNPLDPIDHSAILIPQFLLLAIGENAHFQGGALIGAASALDGLHAESRIMQEIWRAITHQADDYSTLIAGWISSLWGIGLIYQLSAEGMEGMPKSRKKPSDINFAKTYAETILGVVCSGQFSTLIQAALRSATGESTEAPGADTNTLLLKAKLSLLSVALALLLKLEEGTISEMSFSGMLKGEVDLTINDPYHTASLKRALLDEIKLILAALDPEERDLVLYSLVGYMSTNPAIEEMLNQEKVFKNVLTNKSFENELIDKRPLDI